MDREHSKLCSVNVTIFSWKVTFNFLLLNEKGRASCQIEEIRKNRACKQDKEIIQQCVRINLKDLSGDTELKLRRNLINNSEYFISPSYQKHKGFLLGKILMFSFEKDKLKSWLETVPLRIWRPRTDFFFFFFRFVLFYF